MCARETLVGFPLRVQSKAANGGPDFCTAKISRRQKEDTRMGVFLLARKKGFEPLRVV